MRKASRPLPRSARPASPAANVSTDSANVPAENVLASADALGRARSAVQSMYRTDRASQNLGLEILDVAPGSVRVSMTVRPEMVNGHGLCHGGIIFTLADSAFAFACNSHGEPMVAAGASIEFLAPTPSRRTLDRARHRSLARRASWRLRCARHQEFRRDRRAFPRSQLAPASTHTQRDYFMNLQSYVCGHWHSGEGRRRCDARCHHRGAHRAGFLEPASISPRSSNTRAA